jgi:hypothetical protein
MFICPRTIEEDYLITSTVHTCIITRIVLIYHSSQQISMQMNHLMLVCCSCRSTEQWKSSHRHDTCTLVCSNGSTQHTSTPTPFTCSQHSILSTHQIIAAQRGFLSRENRLSATQRHFMQPYRLVMVVARLCVSRSRGLEGFIQMKPIK